MNDEPLDLDVNLNDVDTGRPVLPQGLYVMKVDNVEIADNNAGTGRNLIVDFATTQPCHSIKDQPINVGFRVRNYYPLQPSEKNPTSDFWKQQLARLQDAVTGSTKGNRPKLQLSELREQCVLVDLDVEEDPEYGDQNRVKRLRRLEDDVVA